MAKKIDRVRVRTWYVTIGCPDPRDDFVEKVKAIDALAAGALCMPPSGSKRFIKDIRPARLPKRAPPRNRTGTSALRKRRSEPLNQKGKKK